MSSKIECSICVETVAIKNTYKCKNPECNLEACIVCIKKYLIESSNRPACMSCKFAYSIDDFVKYFPKSWRLKQYKEHTKDIIWSKEQSKMNETQDYIVKQSLIKKENEKIQKLKDEIYECQTIIFNLNLTDDINSTLKNKNTYTYKCPSEDCNGSLNKNYLCAICETQYCKDCFEVINEDNTTHECDEEKKATVLQIKKEAKPCPGCKTLISYSTGCFGENTEILMWNGTIKMSQDIQIGDTLVGDDGNPRTVKVLFNGEDDLYEISQTTGETYVVNSEHTLVLKYSSNRVISFLKEYNAWSIKWFDTDNMCAKQKQIKVTDTISYEESKRMIEEFGETLMFPEVIEIKVKDYLKITSKKTLNLLVGFKSNGINWPKKEILIDPYLLGIWLGDGSHSSPNIASNDIEIQKYLLEWCDNNDAELVHQGKYSFKIRRRNLTNYIDDSRLPVGNDSCDNCLGCSAKRAEICDIVRPLTIIEKPNEKTNPFMDLLNKYNLYKNKHIPEDFMTNDRDVRLKLLAGLIDSDGHVPKEFNGKRITIAQSRWALTRQIGILAKSLGFIVNTRIVERKNVKTPDGAIKDYPDHLGLNISGTHLEDIPTILPRKKCNNSEPNKDYLRTSIKVKHIGKGEYYGWSIDGNKRFILKDFTVVRNCDQIFCTSCGTAFSWKTGEIEKGIIHNPYAGKYFEEHPEARDAYINRLNNRNQDNCEIDQYTLFRNLRTLNLDNELIYIVQDLFRNIYNFRNRNQEITEPNNQDYRIKWLKNTITEEHFKKTTFQRHKKYQKDTMDNEVLITACTLIYDLIRKMCSPANIGEFMKIWNNDLDNIVNYTNCELENISEYFGLKAKLIDKSFYIR